MPEIGMGVTIIVDPPAAPPVVIVPTPGPPGPAGGIQSIVAGDNVTVDDTDPDNPIISTTGGGGGGGAVDSVNGHTGVVVLGHTDVGADAVGDAEAARVAAIAAADAYTDGKIVAEVARADTAYDPAGAASSAQTAAEGYTDTKVAAEVTRANGAYDALGAAAVAQAAAITAAATDATTKVAAEATARTAAIATQHTADLAAFDAAGAASSAQTAAISAAATDATTKANAAQAFAIQRGNHTGTQTADTITDGTTNKAFLATERTKLAGITSGATAVTVGAAGSGAGNALSANDATTTNSRTPTAHHTAHESGGADALSLAASQITSGVLAIGRLATGTPDGTKFVADDGTLKTPSSGGGGSAVPVSYIAPTGGLYETFPRGNPTSGTQDCGTGNLVLVAITLPTGFSVTKIGFISNSQGAVSPTHWWFGLYDQNRVQLAVTADQTTTAWASRTIKTLNIATTAAGAGSSFTTTYTGLYYIGIMMTATTTVNLFPTSTDSTLYGATPILAGTADTGQTTPPAFPHTANALGTARPLCYGFVG